MLFVEIFLLVVSSTYAAIDIPTSEGCQEAFGKTHTAYFDTISGRCFYFADRKKGGARSTGERCEGDDSNCCGPGHYAHIDNAHLFYNIFMDFSQDGRYGYRGWRLGFMYWDFWVGIDRSDSDSYQFTGTNIDIDKYYTAWKSGEPDGLTCAVGHNKGIKALSCSNDNLFLCELQVNDTGCPRGFFQNTTTNKCYMIRDDRTATFQRARRWCYDHGADMFTVNSQEEKEVLTSFEFVSDTTFWIGMTDIAHEGYFFWVNGHRVTWNDWHGTTEPNNHQDAEHCVQMYNANNGNNRNDVKCNEEHHYVCQRPKFRASENGGCPGDSWRYVETGRCYSWYPTVSKNEAGAFEFCEQKGGFLATRPEGLEDRFQALVSSFPSLVWYNGTTMSDFTYGKPLCEFNPPQGAQGACSDGYFYHQHLKTCYRIVNTQTKTWNDARADCQTVTAGDLIQVTSRDVYDFVAISMIDTIWIGAKRYLLSDETSFVWVRYNISVLTSEPYWAKDEPSGGDERCVGMYNSWNHMFHQWNDVSCTRHFNYICEHTV